MADRIGWYCMDGTMKVPVIPVNTPHCQCSGIDTTDHPHRSYLKIAGGSRLALADQMLTFSVNGILKTGGDAAEIGGGPIAGSATGFSFRTAAVIDTLTITSALIDARAERRLYQIRPRPPDRAGTNSCSGTTAVRAGTLEIDGRIGGPVAPISGVLTGPLRPPATGRGAAGRVVTATALVMNGTIDSTSGPERESFAVLARGARPPVAAPRRRPAREVIP